MQCRNLCHGSYILHSTPVTETVISSFSLKHWHESYPVKERIFCIEWSPNEIKISSVEGSVPADNAGGESLLPNKIVVGKPIRPMVMH